MKRQMHTLLPSHQWVLNNRVFCLICDWEELEDFGLHPFVVMESLVEKEAWRGCARKSQAAVEAHQTGAVLIKLPCIHPRELLTPIIQLTPLPSSIFSYFSQHPPTLRSPAAPPSSSQLWSGLSFCWAQSPRGLRSIGPAVVFASLSAVVFGAELLYWHKITAVQELCKLLFLYTIPQRAKQRASYYIRTYLYWIIPSAHLGCWNFSSLMKHNLLIQSYAINSAQTEKSSKVEISTHTKKIQRLVWECVSLFGNFNPHVRIFWTHKTWRHRWWAEARNWVKILFLISLRINQFIFVIAIHLSKDYSVPSPFADSLYSGLSK